MIKQYMGQKTRHSVTQGDDDATRARPAASCALEPERPRAATSTTRTVGDASCRCGASRRLPATEPRRGNERKLRRSQGVVGETRVEKKGRASGRSADGARHRRWTCG